VWWQCRNAPCGKRVALLSGTRSSGSMRLSMPVLVHVVFAYTHDRGVIQASGELNVSAKTLIMWFSHFRDICTNACDCLLEAMPWFSRFIDAHFCYTPPRNRNPVLLLQSYSLSPLVTLSTLGSKRQRWENLSSLCPAGIARRRTPSGCRCCRSCSEFDQSGRCCRSQYGNNECVCSSAYSPQLKRHHGWLGGIQFFSGSRARR
jgi:hypothetical protein